MPSARGVGDMYETIPALGKAEGFTIRFMILWHPYQPWIRTEVHPAPFFPMFRAAAQTLITAPPAIISGTSCVSHHGPIYALPAKHYIFQRCVIPTKAIEYPRFCQQPFYEMGACHPIDRKVKIMLLNPIGTSGFNDWTAETVIQYKDPKTHVTIVSLADRIGGSQTLAYPAIRPLLYAEMIRACLQARREKYDALIVNCFGDPMVDELRQIAGDMIVLGARQASLHTASRLGNKYAVILPYEMKGSPDPLHQRLLADTEAAVSHPVVDVAFNNDLTPRDLKTLQERLAKQGSRAVERDGAQVLILGCTAMLACWQGVMQAAGVPVVDPTVAALKAAAEAVKLRRELGWGTSTVKAENAPTKEELYMISQSEQVYPFSGRIEIE